MPGACFPHLLREGGKQMSLGSTGKDQKHRMMHAFQQSILSSAVKGYIEKTVKLRGEIPVKLNN